MKTHHTYVLLTLISLLFLTGCWNSRELNEMAIVVGIGIDKVPESGQYRVSLQIVNPSSFAASKASGGGKGMMPNIVYSSTDQTLFSAFRKTTQKVSRRLFFAHSQLLVIGEPLAKKGINDLFDFFERSHELRLTSSVVIARGLKAEALLKTLTPLETTSAESVRDKLLVTSGTWAYNADEDVLSIIKSMHGPGEPVISGVRVIGDPAEGEKKSNLERSLPSTTIEMKGIGIFADRKLTAWLDGESARGAVWALNKMKSTIVNIDCDNKKEAISIEIIRSSTKVRAIMRSGKPVLSLHVKEEGNLSEADCPINPDKHKVLVKLQKQLTEETRKEIKAAIKAAQRKKSDIFGFSTEMERTHPTEWKKMKNNWPAIYSQSEVEVHVEAYIRRTGLRIKSYLKSED